MPNLLKLFEVIVFKPDTEPSYYYEVGTNRDEIQCNKANELEVPDEFIMVTEVIVPGYTIAVVSNDVYDARIDEIIQKRKTTVEAN